jgi:predicted phosphodiesterase
MKMKDSKRIIRFLWLFLIPFAINVKGQVTRKPYLQIPTPTSMIVRWQTGTGVVGKLYYGTSHSSLTNSVPESEDERIYHEVKVTGLQPNTKYFYSVSGPMKGSKEQYFITPPETGKAVPVRIWVISDFGQTSSAQNPRRLETIARWDTFNNNSYHANFVLSLGDQTEDDAIYQIQHDYFSLLENVFINSPLYTVIGNHDNHDSIYNYVKTFTLPEYGEAGGAPSGTEKYYSFDYSNIHVVVLCSEIYDEEGIKEQTEWLRKDLELNHQTWLVACLHQPFHSGGYHPSDNNKSTQIRRQQWLPVLWKYGVDLILQGHNHIYERSYMVDNLVGKAMELSMVNKIDTTSGRQEDGTPYHKKINKPGQGTVFITCAAGGVANPSKNFVHYPIFHVYYSAAKVEGSLVIDVNDKRMDVRFICNESDAKGNHIWDHFTIIKN